MAAPASCCPSRMFAGTPDPIRVAAVESKPLTYVDCCPVMLPNVCEKGRKGAPIVTELVSPWATLLVKKPDSFLRRCSKAKKKKVRSWSRGPPIVKPYCLRLKGGLATG